jgi:hypothetical protein
MIFRNKALKTTAAAIAIISMVGAGTINYVHADSSLVSQGVAIERTVNNEYDIEYDVIYISPEGDRLEGGQGVDEAKLVLDGTTYRLKRKEPNYCRKANDIFLQFLHMTGMEADIMQYDEESKSRKSIAKCYISSIDFDSGEITGVSYTENSATEVKISFDENSDAKLETI